MSISSSRVASAERLSTPSTTIQRRTVMLALAGIVLLVCLLRLPGLVLPLERDEGAYAYVAHIWLQGGLPYRDAFDHKPPLIYLMYMPPLAAGLPMALAVRLWSMLLCLANVGLVYAIGRQVWERHTTLLAALLFGIAGSAFNLQGLILNTDQAMVLPVLAALWSAIKWHQSQRFRFAVGTGLGLAAALLTKPVAIVLVPTALLASHRSVASMARMIGGMLLGAMIIVISILGYFAARSGWSEFVFAVLTYNLSYARESQERWQLGPLVDMFAPFMPLTLVALGGIFLTLFPPKSVPLDSRVRGSQWLVVGWAAALLLAALGSLRAFIHYYYPIIPALALLAAPCIVWLANQHSVTTRVQYIAARLAPALLLAFLIVPFGLQNVQLVGLSAEQQAERLYGDSGKYYFAPADQVAAYVRDHTQPTDYIYIFASEPQIYLLAERRSSSRYIYDYPLTLVPHANDELRRELTAKPPRLIVAYYGLRPPILAAMLQNGQFVKLTEIGGFEIFGPR